MNADWLEPPISGVSANSCGCALRGVSLQARPARWTARRWHASAAAAIHGFADGASQPPDVLCIQDRKAELIGIFDAYIHPRRTAMTCTRPFPLAMDGNALNVMRSPKLENHYTFVIDQRAARAVACPALMGQEALGRTLPEPR
jgi:hypothetical protein